MSPVGPVLVPLDGSRAAQAVLPVARAVARLTGASLWALYVGEERLNEAELIVSLGLGAFDREGIVLEQRPGAPAAVIARVASAADASVVALTTYGREGPVPGSVLGLTARALLGRVRQPLLFVRPGSRRTEWPTGAPRRVLFALRDDRSSTRSARWPAGLAARARAELDVLLLVRFGRWRQSPLSVPVYVDQPQQEWPAWVAEAERRFVDLLGWRPPVPLRLAAAAEEPAAAVLGWARLRGTDLIALVRAPSDPLELVAAVMAAATCPVAVLRPVRSVPTRLASAPLPNGAGRS